MPDFAQGIVTQVVGSLVGFGLPTGVALYTARRRLQVIQVGVPEYFYLRDHEEARGHGDLRVANPADRGAQLMLTVDLQCLNRSIRSDGIRDIRLVALGDRCVDVVAKLRADETFHGLNLPGTSMEWVRTRFFLNPSDVGVGDVRDDVPWPEGMATARRSAVLRITTVRRETLDVRVSGEQFVRLHQHRVGVPGVLHYLSVQASLPRASPEAAVQRAALGIVGMDGRTRLAASIGHPAATALRSLRRRLSR